MTGQKIIDGLQSALNDERAANRARIAALESQVAAADRLAAATTAFDLLSRDETFCTVEEADVEIERLFIALRNALAAYRAAKGE